VEHRIEKELDDYDETTILGSANAICILEYASIGLDRLNGQEYSS
jgi:hypothetical protein